MHMVLILAALGLLAYWIYSGMTNGTGPLAGFFGTAS